MISSSKSASPIVHAPPPIQPDQEWANALTHGVAAAIWTGLAIWLVVEAFAIEVGLAIACAAYGASVIGTFVCSTLSHTFLQRPLLDHLRAWDQAMIYLMIIGTYTPITYQYAAPEQRTVLLTLMWTAAIAGFVNKAILRHRIHSISTWSYLALGWLPAIPLIGRVPMGLAIAMFAGGVTYSVGVIFLMNDRKFPYLHAVWHLFVITASIVHLAGIAWYVLFPEGHGLES
ncbi:PAQR family membrane homeostasis protein TrhA [Neorhodopirellula pilleata]|uniref:Hemolysin-III related n=1 Tax=Neorhodopirellula pilleata TaxID=2714738 RepID=A0A5C5ZKC7_9BACT|nr:hemolysin III family protein [Neorhodopirellula pilleata]TWT87904.1 hemolysin-III related [Neorhodopirellula pilleata]